MIVRKVKAIKSVDDLFSENDIFIEYGDKTVTPTTGKGLFYREDNKTPNGLGLSLDFLAERHGGFDKYFQELDPVKFSETPWAKIAEPKLRSELQTVTETVLSWQQREQELKKLLSIYKDKEEIVKFKPVLFKTKLTQASPDTRDLSVAIMYPIHDGEGHVFMRATFLGVMRTDGSHIFRLEYVKDVTETENWRREKWDVDLVNQFIKKHKCQIGDIDNIWFMNNVAEAVAHEISI